MKKFIIIPLVAIITACSGIKVVSDRDKTVDFSQYKTFNFYGWSDKTEKMLNRFDKERIENAVRNEFEKRGIRYAQKDGELLITLIVVVDEIKDETAMTDYYGYYGGYGYFGRYYGYGPGYPWGPTHSITRVTENVYLKGTLVIDVFDADRKLLVWEGIGTQIVNEQPERREKMIPKAVEKIMDRFPKKIIK